MPLFLKNIDAELDIFGNRQILNFNQSESCGENESALSMINWFTPILNINTNCTLEFLTPELKGFRFNHSLSTTGVFGNFNFEKYDRFGVPMPLWGYDEQTDIINFYKPVTNLQITSVPIGSLDAANKAYIDNHTWLSSQITDFDTQVRKSRLDQFLPPISSINMANNKLINLANGVLSNDAINKSQLDNKLINLSGSVTGNSVLDGNGNYSLTTKMNMTQSLTGSNYLRYNWFSSNYESGHYHTLSESNSSAPGYIEVVEAGATSSTYRRWITSQQVGLGTSRFGKYELGFYHGSDNVHETPLTIQTYGNTLRTWLRTTLDINYNPIINLANGISSTDAVNKGQLDSINSNLSSSINSVSDNLDYKTNWYVDQGWAIASYKPWVIDGYFYGGYAEYGWLNASGDTGHTIDDGNISLHCTDRIRASEFNAISSIKKKKIISSGAEIEQETIDLLKQVKFVKYRYKDQQRDGSAICYGVIAEELVNILPAYVETTSCDFVPNIMRKCKVRKLDTNIYSINVKSLDLEIDSDAKKLKLITQEKAIDADILEITESCIKISTDELLEKEEFIYGTYEICPSVSKQKLFELSMVVVQNLLKRVEQLEQQLNNR